MHRQQHAAQQRPEDRAEAPHSQRPAGTGGAHLGRIEIAGKGIQGQLPTDDAKARGEHEHHQVPRVVVVQPQQHGAQRRQGEHCGQQPHLALETIGDPGHADRPQGSGEQEHRSHQVGLLQGQAAFQQQGRQPADHEIQQDQADEEGRPDQQRRPRIPLAEQFHHRELATGLLLALIAARHWRLPVRQHARAELAQARIGWRIAQQAWQRFGQAPEQEREQQQRGHAARQEHRLPAEAIDEAGRDETAGRTTEGETAGGQGHHQGAQARRRIFGHQRHGAGHRPTHANTADKTRGHEAVQGLAEHHQHRQAGVDQHAAQEDPAHAETIRQGRHRQGAQGQAQQVGTEHRAEGGFLQAPVLGQGRYHVAQDLGVVAIGDQQQGEEQQQRPLVAGHRAGVERSAKAGNLVLHRKVPVRFLMVMKGDARGAWADPLVVGVKVPQPLHSGCRGRVRPGPGRPGSGRSVGLVGRVRGLERRMLGSQRGHPANPRVGLQRHLEALGGVQLRDQEHIGQSRLLAEAEAGIADQLFQGCQALADPVVDPHQQLRLLMAPFTQQVLRAGVVQGMHVATDDGRHGPGTGTADQVLGQQRHLWITLLQVLDDRQRLDQQVALVGTQGRNPALGVDLQVLRQAVGAALGHQQVDRDGLVVQALEAQGDPHPVGRGGTVIGIKLHTALPLAGR